MKLFQWHGAQVKAQVNQNIKDAILTSLAHIERSAKQLCRVDTGRMRGAISINWTGSGRDRGAVDAVAHAEDGVGQPGAMGTQMAMRENTIFAGVCGLNVEYAPYQELGTEKMSAQPFLRPAFDEHKDFRKYLRRLP